MGALFKAHSGRHSDVKLSTKSNDKSDFAGFKMNKPKALIILDPDDSRYVDLKAASDHWDLSWVVLDYKNLHREVDRLRAVIAQSGASMVVYSRNDQVADRVQVGQITRKLRLGYTSFSAIDEQERVQQMRTCFDDFLVCNKALLFNQSGESSRVALNGLSMGTFSLVFDVEQIGCVRYGFPRISRILSKYGVKATFFVTNLVNRVYPTFVKALLNDGHEVGIHGHHHEYLSGLDVLQQANSIKKMKRDFPCTVHGANFLGRMDKATVTALFKTGVDYFVSNGINYYRPFAYPKLSVKPVAVACEDGVVWMLPISVETYDLPWLSIKNMVDSAVLCSKKQGSPHITVLMHMFRDGNLRHLDTTEKLVKYLTFNKALTPTTLHQMKESYTSIVDSFVDAQTFEEAAKKLSRRQLVVPETRQDLLGFFENFVSIKKRIDKTHTAY